MKPICKPALAAFSLILFMPASDTKSSSDLMNPPRSAAFQQRELPTGIWGGKHISLEITDSGGSIEFDCAHGTIEGKIKLNQQGRFSIKGTYIEEHGGPVRQTGNADSQTVLYTGQITGEKMKLTIKRSDNKKLVGTFTLARDQEAFLVKCR